MYLSSLYNQTCTLLYIHYSPEHNCWCNCHYILSIHYNSWNNNHYSIHSHNLHNLNSHYKY